MNMQSDQIDYRLYLVKLFRLLGIPVLVYFSIEDIKNRNYYEAIFTIFILVFVLSINYFLNKLSNKKILYRIGLFLLIFNFFMLMIVNDNIVDQIIWMFVIPIPLALLLGLKEGIVWNIGLISLLFIELLNKYKLGFVSSDFFLRFMVIFSIVSIFSLMTEHVRKLYNDLAIKYSISDPLTGAFNRFGLNQPLENLLKRSYEQKSSLSVILCDVDNLKEINDSLGHLAGDNILKKFVEIANNLIRRQTDVIIRYGGDEFLIILPFTSIENAHILAEKIIDEINKVSLNTKNGFLSCSFGIAGTEEIDLSNIIHDEIQKDELVEKLIHLADIQLYKAKEKDGNKIRTNHT